MARDKDKPRDKDKERDWEEKVGRKRVGAPFSTEREVVEQGKPREGTNLDLGEERSAEQEEEIREIEKRDAGTRGRGDAG